LSSGGEILPGGGAGKNESAGADGKRGAAAKCTAGQNDSSTYGGSTHRPGCSG
jgi:hypothetical protein